MNLTFWGTANESPILLSILHTYFKTLKTVLPEDLNYTPKQIIA